MGLFDNLKKASILDYHDPVTRAISELPKHKTCLVVMRDRSYAGIVDDWTITSSAAEHTSKVGSVSVHAPTITKKTSVLNICRLFSSGPYRALPVMEGEKVVGVLPRNEVLRVIADEGLLDKKKVADVMETRIPKIEAKAHLGKAKSKMDGNQYGKLAVTEDGKLLGVLTAYDFAAFLSRPKDKLPFRKDKVRLEDVEVSSIMRQKIYTIKPEASLKESAREMVDKDVAALVVESSGAPVGIISARQLFKCVVEPEEIGLEISGLGEEDRMFAEDIREECMKFLKKLQKSFDVEHMYLHLKRYGKKYSVHGKLRARRAIYSASSFGWDLRVALKSFLDEMERIFHKNKEDRVHRKKMGGRKSERWIE